MSHFNILLLLTSFRFHWAFIAVCFTICSTHWSINLADLGADKVTSTWKRRRFHVTLRTSSTSHNKTFINIKSKILTLANGAWVLTIRSTHLNVWSCLPCILRYLHVDTFRPRGAFRKQSLSRATKNSNISEKISLFPRNAICRGNVFPAPLNCETFVSASGNDVPFKPGLMVQHAKLQRRSGGAGKGVIKNILYGEATPRGQTVTLFLLYDIFDRKTCPFVTTYCWMKSGTPNSIVGIEHLF